jgi:ferredoxin
MGPEIYEIAPALCTECVGHFDEPQCKVVCPVDCIIVNPGCIETRDQLQDKVDRLRAAESAKSDN